MAAIAPKNKDLPMPQKLLDEARRLNVDIGHRSEEELRKAVNEAWLEENREAIEGWNAWVRENGLPLEAYRAF